MKAIHRLSDVWIAHHKEHKQMDPTGYYEIHMELVYAIGNVWEIWLTVTFEVIVAIHIGRESINRVLFSIGTSLYVLAALAMLQRYLNYIGSMGMLRQEALDAGYTVFPQDMDGAMVLSILTIITMGAGTLATVILAIYQHRHHRS
jgi:hypothetical protein